MLLLFRRGGGSSTATITPAGHGRAIERHGKIHYFDSDAELERFLAEQESIPIAKAARVVKEIKASGFNALQSVAVVEEIAAPFISTPLPRLSRRERKIDNDDDEAIALLMH